MKKGAGSPAPSVALFKQNLAVHIIPRGTSPHLHSRSEFALKRLSSLVRVFFHEPAQLE
jgi:hypothetical protein